MARTKQRRTYLPYTFPAIAGLRVYRPQEDGGLSKPKPMEQRATGPRLLRDSSQRGRWPTVLNTRPPRQLSRVGNYYTR